MRFRTMTYLPGTGAFAALLAIGACSPTSPRSNVSSDAAPSAGNQVAALAEGQRNGVFIRAIRDAGQDCQHVESSQPAGRYREMPVWRATCRGGSHWTIMIADNGTAQILNADQAQLVTDQAAHTAANQSGQ